MSFLLKGLFKSNKLSPNDLKIIKNLEEALKGMDYDVEYSKLYIVVKVKRE